MCKGIVKWFNSTKGYGFIIPDDGGDELFVHASEIKAGPSRGLDKEQPVQFEVLRSRSGLRAVNVIPLLKQTVT